jgi:TRAP-type mannitol/chloroaromatic compound transport system permease small subunit
MCLVFSLIPATVLVVLGYLVLVASKTAEGPTKTVGRALAVWVFVIALSFPIGGAYITLSGICPMEEVMQQMGEVRTSGLPTITQR